MLEHTAPPRRPPHTKFKQGKKEKKQKTCPNIPRERTELQQFIHLRGKKVATYLKRCLAEDSGKCSPRARRSQSHFRYRREALSALVPPGVLGKLVRERRRVRALELRRGEIPVSGTSWEVSECRALASLPISPGRGTRRCRPRPQGIGAAEGRGGGVGGASPGF